MSSTFSLGRSICYNNRAKKLMRRLRRFAIEHGGIPTAEQWRNDRLPKYCIQNCVPRLPDKCFLVVRDKAGLDPEIGALYFLDRLSCEEAMMAFKDELIWYFTDYLSANY